LSKEATVPQKKHMGTKFLFGLFLAMLLAVIYVVGIFFGYMEPLTDEQLMSIAKVTAFFMTAYILLIFLGETLWRFVHKYSECF
jgi:hypothetical protein